MTETFATQTALPSSSGATLNLYYQPAGTEGQAVVLINHGLAEHAARYARFAAFLAARGFHVYAHDHRGHGATSAPDAPLGVFGAQDCVDLIIQDVAAVHQQAMSSHPGLPVFLFGHSMGGLIALNYVMRRPENVHAAAIWNANFSAGLLGRVAQAILAYERMRLGSDATSVMLPKLTFRDWARKIPNHRTRFDWLSRDPVEVDRYVEDPLCGWDASVGMWQSLFKLIFFGADNGNFPQGARSIPFHLVGGGSDPATNGGNAVTALARRMRRNGFTDVTGRIYEDTRHESLNEINRQGIMEDFSAWASRVLSDLRAPASPS